MSISKEEIAEAHGVKPEEVKCEACKYSTGEFLMKCELWSRIMGRYEFCTFWDKREEARKS